MQKTLFFIAFVLISLLGYAQSDTLYQGGKYYNTNIFVYNPDMDGEYSIQKIIVNEDTIHEDLATNGIEIDLSSLNLKEEDPVELKIIYKSGNEPSIVNPEALSNQQKFRFSRPKIYKGKLQWRINGSASDYPIVIEEYKWNEWRVVGEVDPLDTVKNNLYQYEIGMHSGTNIIRIHTTNIQGQKVVSKVLRFVPPRVPKIVLESTKVKEDITFSSETEYELYEIGGKLIKKGVERYVDVRDLPKGEYWLNYDNTTVKIKKK